MFKRKNKTKSTKTLLLEQAKENEKLLNKENTFSYKGRGNKNYGGGYAIGIMPPKTFRSTTNQLCGLFPFVAGSSTPTIGVPLGKHIYTSSTVCCDPLNWFTRAKLVSNPSVFVLGKPGLGKSTIIRRMCLGLAGQNTLPLILGDLKPDYVDLIKSINGQIISIGHGKNGLNPLDITQAQRAVKLMEEKGYTTQAQTLLLDAKARRANLICALLEIIAKKPLTPKEETIITTCITEIENQNPNKTPIIQDITNILSNPTNQIRKVALDQGNIQKYYEITDNIHSSLIALDKGQYGKIFTNQTHTQIDITKPVVYDISAIDNSSSKLKAAVLLACWQTGFLSVAVNQTLADLQIIPRQHYFVVMDELWNVLRAGNGMVDRIDALTRLNRSWGVAQAMITHTMSDLEALPNPEDRAKAKGFVERAGLVLCAGLPESEMPLLNSVIQMSQQEQNLLTSWSSPPSWDRKSGSDAPPPGRGKFLIKVGSRPGIPVYLQLTKIEKEINNTNKRW